MNPRARIVKGSKKTNGMKRKIVEIPDIYYNDFDFGEVVEISKIQ